MPVWDLFGGGMNIPSKTGREERILEGILSKSSRKFNEKKGEKRGKKGNLRNWKSLDGCRGLASLPEIKKPK